jgi:hypothetical protein
MGRDATRVTTTLTKWPHADLERLEKRHIVKVAWLVCRGVEIYFEPAEGGPLLPLN